jgi:hypothetical protein
MRHRRPAADARAAVMCAAKMHSATAEASAAAAKVRTTAEVSAPATEMAAAATHGSSAAMTTATATSSWTRVSSAGQCGDQDNSAEDFEL